MEAEKVWMRGDEKLLFFPLTPHPKKKIRSIYLVNLGDETTDDLLPEFVYDAMEDEKIHLHLPRDFLVFKHKRGLTSIGVHATGPFGGPGQTLTGARTEWPRTGLFLDRSGTVLNFFIFCSLCFSARTF